MSATLSEAIATGPVRGEALRRFLRDRQGMVGLVIVLLFVGSALAAPLLAPYAPNQIDIRNRMQGPSLLHWLGTDQLGRDILSRVIYGGRIALSIAVISIGVSLSLGLALGIVAGYGPRWLDNLLLLLMDAVRSFPAIIMAMAVVALTGPSIAVMLAVIIVTSIPSYARLARTSTQALKGPSSSPPSGRWGPVPGGSCCATCCPTSSGPC